MRRHHGFHARSERLPLHPEVPIFSIPITAPYPTWDARHSWPGHDDAGQARANQCPRYSLLLQVTFGKVTIRSIRWVPSLRFT